MTKQKLHLSFFQNKRDNKPKKIERSWKELCERFAKPEIRSNKDGALFSPAVFEPALRRNENVKEISLLVFDIDHQADLQTLKAKLKKLDSAYMIYSTHSHLRQTESNPKTEPRFRVCLPLNSAIPAKDFPALWKCVKNQTNLPIDENAKDLARMFYIPSIAENSAPYHFEKQDGIFLDWRKFPIENFLNNWKRQ